MVSCIRRWFAVVLCIVLLASCSATQSSSNLEQQVLDIIRANPDVVIESVQAYQAEQQAQAQSRELADFEAALGGIAADPTSEIGESPTKGSSELQYVLYEFSDFECPFCARMQPVISEFLDNHPEVTLVYKHFPLVQIHPQAVPAAQASWAAQQQDQFWSYHDALFANQDRLGEDYYVELANELNLDMAKFERDRQSATDAIRRDVELGEAIGLNGTPFFTLNGIPLPGAVPLDALESALEQAKQQT